MILQVTGHSCKSNWSENKSDTVETYCVRRMWV